MKHKTISGIAAFLLLAPAGLLLTATPAFAEECTPSSDGQISLCEEIGGEVQLPPQIDTSSTSPDRANILHLEGCVITVTGKPVPAVSVLFHPTPTAPQFTVNTSATGCFGIEVPPGVYTPEIVVPPTYELVTTPPTFTATENVKIPDIVLNGHELPAANTPASTTPAVPVASEPQQNRGSMSICTSPQPLVAGIFAIGVLIVAIAVLLTLAARKRLKNEVAEKARNDDPDLFFYPEQMKFVEALGNHNTKGKENE